MEIKEALEEKRNLNERIAKIVMEFTEKTGLTVQSVDLRRFSIMESEIPVHYEVDTTILI